MNIDSTELNTLSLLGNVTHDLYTSKELGRVLDKITNHTVEHLKVKGCSIKILNERHTKLAIHSVVGLSDEFINEVGVYGMFRSPLNQEALKGNHVFIEDISGETELEIPDELAKEGIRAFASVPLKLEEHVIGVLSIYHDQPRSFDSSEQTFLDLLAMLSSSVINSLRRYKRSKTLLGITKSLTSTLDLDDVLKEIVVSATRSMRCRASSIRLLNESTGQLTFMTSYGLSKKYLEGIPKTLETSPIDKIVLEDKESVFVEDMTTDERIRMQKEAKEEGLYSMICVPLTVADKAIGILKVYYGAPIKLSWEENNYLVSLGELSAVAVKNASLYEKLHSLYQITSSLSSTLETKRLLELITIHAADYMKAMGSNILLWDRDYERFSTRTAYHLPKEFIKQIKFDKNSWSAQETMKGNTIIIGSVEEDERLDIRRQCLDHGIHALVSVPLKIIGRVMGILQVFCKRPRNFTSDEIQFLTALGNHGAVALENAQMHEHFRSEYERLVDDIYVWHDWTSYVIRE